MTKSATIIFVPERGIFSLNGGSIWIDCAIVESVCQCDYQYDPLGHVAAERYNEQEKKKHPIAFWKRKMKSVPIRDDIFSCFVEECQAEVAIHYKYEHRWPSTFIFGKDNDAKNAFHKEVMKIFDYNKTQRRKGEK